MKRKRVGVIGGGQLAWMMAKAAQKLGIDLVVQTPHPDDPAVKIAAETILAAVDDAAATVRLANRCDVITFENEFINLEALKPLAERGVCFRPSLEALSPLLDKYHQRCYLKEIRLPVPRFIALKRDDNAFSCDLKLNFPIVLKSRRHGYDGQGTFIISDRDELEAIYKRFPDASWLLEEFIPFERELAVIAARSVAGEVVIYPVVETYQKDRVCHWVIVPAALAPEIELEIERIARHLLEKLQVVGVFGIELFLTQDGKVLVNEIAPRTHNSGHYTLDACETSQFEMQLRAVTELSLGSSALKCSGAVMVNLLGYEHSHSNYQEKRDRIAAIPHAYLHWYDKTESRPGRKLGHVTVLLESETATSSSQSVKEQLLEIARKIETLWYGA
ncbi:phosphoribosylaminoimidazole carboxylase, PurK protein [Pleurocapsa sp. PCC 7327]|uniref:5-(carboxyamino)imidazole ribonucleotide synthase n=1 Tax=Pleurocapsa sp. PCC 7327 TaxID=118163 RepID=UPI00029FBC80|nr:5-(carboxyamino)imidazole ribonucleotide synthase [Pleurocapsa sp. PCC 7327]AFY77153.1 phosphoribosylaminoimidazole carboxylase, PurK protein [Pleurocapsa sp. PCC 7327]